MTTWKIPEACADISESDIRRQDEEVLRLLLVDRTLTSHNGRWTNIKWGTGDYALSHPGVAGFSADDEIPMDLISSADGRDLKVVTPRVRCRAYRGTDKSVWYDQRECEGPIAEQIHDAYAFVCKNMRVGSELVATRRRDVYELPVGSVREAICNAKCNEPLNEPVNEPLKKAVVQAIRKTPGIGRPALMRIVGKSRATLTRILSELVAQRLVEHRGSDKTGGYFPAASAQKEAK